MTAEVQPELIFIDANVLDEANWAAISKLKTERPATRILVLTENSQQRQRAKEAGADFILPHGFPAAELAHLIENSLLHDTRGETNQEKMPGEKK